MGERRNTTPKTTIMDRLHEARAEPERMAEGTFPLACKLGGRRVAWPADEVLDWCAARKRDRVALNRAPRHP